MFCRCLLTVTTRILDLRPSLNQLSHKVLEIQADQDLGSVVKNILITVEMEHFVCGRSAARRLLEVMGPMADV